MTKLMNKKGQALNALQSIAIGFVTVVIVMVIGFNIVGKVKETQTPGSAAANASSTGEEALQTMVDFLPIIALVAVGGIVLFFVARFLANRG